MRREKEPYWIRHSHFFDPDEYECSRCGTRARRKTLNCPNCGVALRREKDDQGWVDEAEFISCILDDD